MKRRISISLTLLLSLIAPVAFAELVWFGAKQVSVITATTCDLTIGEEQISESVSVVIYPETNGIRVDGYDVLIKGPSNLPSGLLLGTFSFEDQWGNTRRGLVDTSKTLALQYQRTVQGYPNCTTTSEHRFYVLDAYPVPSFDLEPEDISYIRQMTNWVKGYVESGPKNENSKPKTRNACMCVRG